MSSNSCVVPIDWQKLTGELIPHWCDLLQHKLDLVQFTNVHIPRHDEVLDLYLADFNNELNDIPSTYIQEIGWESSEGILSADVVRRSPTHAALQKAGIIETTTLLLCTAIKQGACVRLSGEDRFLSDSLHSYYGRTENGLQVAGTKNRFRFLEAVFDVDWLGEQSSEYEYREKRIISPRMAELLRKLFLAERTLPGVEIRQAANRWPSYNGDTIQGYLTPNEVRELANSLSEISELLDEAKEDTLYPLFADRIQRAARDQLGLITLYDGLFCNW